MNRTSILRWSKGQSICGIEKPLLQLLRGTHFTFISIISCNFFIPSTKVNKMIHFCCAKLKQGEYFHNLVTLVSTTKLNKTSVLCCLCSVVVDTEKIRGFNSDSFSSILASPNYMGRPFDPIYPGHRCLFICYIYICGNCKMTVLVFCYCSISLCTCQDDINASAI